MMTAPLPKQTEAAVLVALNRPLELMTLDLPGLAAGQALVAVAYSGVCRSQLLEARGGRGQDRYLPHTLGHEGAGTVLAVGPEVTKVQPGDRVILSWIRGGGAEVSGTTYRRGDTVVNSGAVSTFLRHAVTCESRLTPIPAAMPLREAALLGCAVPTGAGIILNTARVRAGQSVAVFGVGGIGLSAVLAAGLVRADPVIALDVAPANLARAETVGATHRIDALQEDPLAALRALTGGRGVDVAVEAAGRRETMEAALAAVREDGGLCVIAGNLSRGERISLDPFDLIRGRRIVGTWGGESDPDRDFPRYADRFLAGELPLARLITGTYPLAEINQALDALEGGGVGRVLIDLEATP